MQTRAVKILVMLFVLFVIDQTFLTPPSVAVRLCWKAPDRSQHLADGASYRRLTVAPSLLIKNNATRIVERLRFCKPGAFFRSSRLMLHEQKIGPSDRALPPRRHFSIPRRWFHCRRASDLRSAEPLSVRSPRSHESPR